VLAAILTNTIINMTDKILLLKLRNNYRWV